MPAYPLPPKMLPDMVYAYSEERAERRRRRRGGGMQTPAMPARGVGMPTRRFGSGGGIVEVDLSLVVPVTEAGGGDNTHVAGGRQIGFRLDLDLVASPADRATGQGALSPCHALPAGHNVS